MIRCPRCSEEVFPDDLFCGNCGRKLDSGDAEQLMKTQTELRVEDVRSNLGIVYYKMGKYEEAIGAFKKVLENNPEDEKALEMIALIEKELKEKE